MTSGTLSKDLEIGKSNPQVRCCSTHLMPQTTNENSCLANSEEVYNLRVSGPIGTLLTGIISFLLVPN